MSAARTASAAISRMPAKVQDEVSRCLDNGGTWRDAAAICERAGYPGVNAQNVTNYRKGAHLEWLRRQERVETARAQYAWKVDLVRKYAEDGGPAEAGLAAALEMLESALSGVNAGDIKSLIADKPEKSLRLSRPCPTSAATWRTCGGNPARTPRPRRPRTPERPTVACPRPI